MKAVMAKSFGGPEVLHTTEIPDPIAGPGDVVIAVSVVPILMLETQVRSGWGVEYFGAEPPYVPGRGVAGRVVSVGEATDPTWVGRRVVARTEGGGYAERAVAPMEGLIPIPDGLGLPEAAALLHDGPTALGLADEASMQPEEWVLILAAGGGMGTLLVQLAHAAGARIVGAARGAKKLGLVRELGAEVAVDYSEDGWPGRVREATGGAGPVVVFDGVGGRIGREAFEITARGGRFSAHGASSGEFAGIDPQDAGRHGVRVTGIEQVQFAPADAGRLVKRAMSEAVAGRLRPILGRIFPLGRAADAHAAIEARNVAGKALLMV